MRFSGMLSFVDICSEVTNLHETDNWMWDLICVVPSQVEQFTFPLACNRVIVNCNRVIVKCGWPMFFVVLDPVIESVRNIVLKTSLYKILNFYCNFEYCNDISCPQPCLNPLACTNIDSFAVIFPSEVKILTRQ